MSKTDDFLAHYGVKGMKWGVKKDKDGGATLKVRFRPTYDKDDILNSKAITKAKIDPSFPTGGKDASGRDTSRISKMNTPNRRLVNGLLGTKLRNISWLAGSAATAASIAISGPLAPVTLGLTYATGSAFYAFTGHALYKSMFKNLVKNPPVTVKTKLNAEQYAAFTTGKKFAIDMKSQYGTAKIRSDKNLRVTDLFDREGRNLGRVDISGSRRKGLRGETSNIKRQITG